MANSGGASAQTNGLAIIITNDYIGTNLPKLPGTQIDGDKMELVFKSLGYDICCWKNYTSKDLHMSCQTVSGIVHSSYGCIVVIFSGHGTADVDRKLTYLFTQDPRCEMFLIDDMLKYFMPITSPAIATTPKVFLIDTCLGQTDTCVEAVTVPKGEHAANPIATIDVPPDSNYILAHSTSIGYRSYETANGGIWLNSLGVKIQDKAHCDSVMNILCDVNEDLSQKYQQKNFMTQPSLTGKANSTFYFVPQHSQRTVAVHNASSELSTGRSGPSKPADALSDSNLAHLMKLLVPVVADWELLGVQLGVAKNQLRIIKSKPLLLDTAPRSFLQDTLCVWFQQRPPNKSWPTVNVLCDALKSELMGENHDLADRVRTTLGTST